MGKLKGLAVFVLMGMTFLCAAPDSTAGQPCLTVNMADDIPYELVMPVDPLDQVVARGTCRTYTIRPTLQGEDGSVTVRIEGQGFSLSGGTNPQEVQVGPNREITICSDSTSCGAGVLFIGDREIGSVRSNVGDWVLHAEGDEACFLKEDSDGPIRSYITGVNHYQRNVELIFGRHKQLEIISRSSLLGSECGCKGFQGSVMGGYCNPLSSYNMEGERCLGYPVFENGVYPCRPGQGKPKQVEPPFRPAWCACVVVQRYWRFECSSP